MELVPEFSFTAQLKPPVAIGGPYGQRLFVEVIEGQVTGERLNGKVLTGGGDWAIVTPDGFLHVDVRLQIATDDGAFLLLTYVGLLEFNEAAQNALANATGTDFGDHYFRTLARLETGDPRYAWANQAVFVGEGHVLPELAVEYRLARVA